MSIPKVFHQVWLGGEMPEPFVSWQKTWQFHHPDWKLVTWTDGDVEELAPYFPRLPELLARCPNLSQKSNVLRYHVLLEYGGVYVDADFECFRNFESLLTGANLFAAWQMESAGLPEAMACGLFGAVPGHPLLRTLVDLLPDQKIETFRTLGPRYFTEHARRHLTDMRVLEKRLIYPYSWDELHLGPRARELFPHAYAAHHWAGKWFAPSFGGAEPVVKSLW